MAIVQNLMDRLRPLVGLKGWDYCVLWKLSDDQRFLEWIDCCCAGTDQNCTQNGGEELHFPVSPVLPCRDLLFQHPIQTKSCELLSQLSTSIPLDSGIYEQTLISNQPQWLNFSNTSNSDAIEETVWTRVLIPAVGGLIELFVTKEVPEDQHVIDFISAQCSISMQQEAMINTSNNMEATSSVINMNEMNELQSPFLADHGNGIIKDHNNNNHFQAQGLENNIDGPYGISVDRIRTCNSPIHFLQQFTESKPRNGVCFEGSPHDFSFLSDNKQMGSSFHPSSENGILEMDALTNGGTIKNMHMRFMEPNDLANDQEQQGGNNDKDSIKQDIGRSDSMSDCSDQLDDEDDAKSSNRRRNGRPPSKNLVAERKRRKKLNDRLYALRALVPKISKLDRAAILVDAIDFVKELQQQAKELQDELEDNSDDDGGTKNNAGNNGSRNNVKSESLSQNGMILGPKTEHDKAPNGFHMGNGRVLNQDQDSENPNDKGQQMEAQVEVAQLEGNEFFVKVFCEHKPRGFVRLIEALNSLDLEVTSANVTSHIGLVSNLFKVKKRDSEMVQAEHVRDSLLELTRDPSRQWPEKMAKVNSESMDNNGMEYRHHQHHHDHHLHNHHISSHHHQHLHHLHN